LSVSAGAGHGRAAEALRAQAELSFPNVEAKHFDVMTLVPRSFRALYANYYIEIVERHPSVWAYLYHATDKMPRDALFAQIRRAIERLNTRKLRDAIRLFDPDHIVCTHFLPAELLAHEIRRARAVPPVWVQVTDFDLHRLWVQAGMRGYFAASDEIAFRMAARGTPKNSVHVTGIPIMPVFAQHLDRKACEEQLGIAPDKVRHSQGHTRPDVAGAMSASVASRSTITVGSAIVRTAEALIEKGKRVASLKLEAAEGDIVYRDGAFAVAGICRSLPRSPSALQTAIMMAPMPPVVPASPTPLTPSGLVVASTGRLASRISGMSVACGTA